MLKKECELCSKPARMFCESDQASLCWECDEKVHAANFLVAKHSRTLLCHVCHSPTPWKAGGPRLGATVSVCHACARRGGPAARHEHHSTSHIAETDADREYYTTDSDDDSSEEDEDEDDEEEEVDVDGENQVVPWSASPPAASSSSTEEDNVSSSSSKRTRDYAFASSEEDEDGCWSSQEAEMSSEESDEYYCSSSSKMRRGNGGGALNPAEQSSLGTAAIVEKLRRFEQQESGTSEMIIGLRNLTRV